MDLGWKVLIPLALGWMLLLATLNIARDEDWNVGLVVGAGLVAMAVAYVLLAGAIRAARHRRVEADAEPEPEVTR
jgi:NADH-quinone oxidoreductase subunit H